jgi:hypothetical protein
MQRDLLFLAEMIDAAEQAHSIAREVSVEDLAKDRRLRDAKARHGHHPDPFIRAVQRDHGRQGPAR